MILRSVEGLTSFKKNDTDNSGQKESTLKLKSNIVLVANSGQKESTLKLKLNIVLVESNIRSFIILRSGEGLTSFNKNDTDNFGQKESRHRS